MMEVLVFVDGNSMLPYACLFGCACCCCCCLQEMDARMMEVLVFVDGIDAMTSKAMQARRSYQPAEMAMNQQVGAARCLAGTPADTRKDRSQAVHRMACFGML